ncbi:DMT family transporter [Actinokineospora sp. HUAS TT18]|uniref:DMT family transporter n=1 Tax=Actinokineospora sp. HUAS TT18 TaxID=3447451 RepID=UPI003F521963
MGRSAGAVVAIGGGVVLALQARINGRLGTELGDGLIAATISFIIGLVILITAVAVTPTARAGVKRLTHALRTRQLQPWQCLGGVVGAWYVTSQGLTVTLLGVAVFTVAVVAGQVMSSLVVDRAGIAPGDPQPITGPRAFGAALAVVAVGVAVSDEFSRPGHLWLALIPALAGAGLGWQQAVNGQVRKFADSVAVASTLNFAVGLVALLIATAVDIAVRGLPNPLPSEWWLYVGGTLGPIALSTAVFAVRLIGVLMVGLCAVAGQLAGAVLLDVADDVVQPATVAGVVITFVAVGVAALPRRE